MAVRAAKSTNGRAVPTGTIIAVAIGTVSISNGATLLAIAPLDGNAMAIYATST